MHVHYYNMSKYPAIWCSYNLQSIVTVYAPYLCLTCSVDCLKQFMYVVAVYVAVQVQPLPMLE